MNPAKRGITYCYSVLLSLPKHERFDPPFALSLSKGRRFAQHRLCRSMNDIRNMTFYEFIIIKEEKILLKQEFVKVDPFYPG